MVCAAATCRGFAAAATAGGGGALAGFGHLGGQGNAAIRVILQATGTPDGAAPPERRGAPVLAASDERRRQVAQQLGIDLEDEEKP